MKDEIKAELKSKHPDAQEAFGNADPFQPPVQEVIFEQVTAETIIQSARTTTGSGGPTKIGADFWRRVLCSKFFDKVANDVAEELARFTRILCTKDVEFDSICTLVACRLVPLMKEDNGTRPIGIGEAVRRIIGKSVTRILSKDIQAASSTLQTSSGLASGIDAAVHSMKKVYEEEWCEGVLLVDAENAFNRLNRKEALLTVKRICPSFHKFLHNTYRNPVNMYMSDGSHILSQEGTTQGDNGAMAMYSLGVTPLITDLASVAEAEQLAQIWFADDSSSGGKLQKLKEWLVILMEKGPQYGYFVKLSKTFLVLKNQEDFERAQHLFKEYDIKITLSGKRHIGAAIGAENFRKEYIGEKVRYWCNDVEKLALFAKDEPQAALSAFTTGLSKRWLFTQRTIENTSAFFEPLEASIREHLIPAIIGRQVSDVERQMISLPPRYGGLGITNPTVTANSEYEASKCVSEPLSSLIFLQDTDV